MGRSAHANGNDAAGRIVAFGLALTPLITLNLSYALAAGHLHVPSCIPYFEGCTSTSSTGRLFPERLVFLPGLVASALLVALFWRRCAAHFDSSSRHANVLRWLGLVAALSLAVYTVSVGQSEELYRLARRAGASLFFVVNFAAQVVFATSERARVARAGRRWLIALIVALLALVLMGEFAKLTDWPRHAVNNIVEWNGIVLVCVYFAVVGVCYFKGSKRTAGRAASPRE